MGVAFCESIRLPVTATVGYDDLHRSKHAR